MSAHQHAAVDEPGGARGPLRRLRWVLWGAALLVGVGAGVALAALRSSPPAAEPAASPSPSDPPVSWGAGERPAPGFALADESGKPVSLAAFRGRPVIVTFVDPLCRDLCPLEAKILESAAARLPAAQRPAILAVSVNRWANARSVLLRDAREWKLGAGWHWAVGAPPALKKVWADYEISVVDEPKRTKGGGVEHEISHTEAAFVVDGNGDERALFFYPFRAADVARAVRKIAAARG